MLQINTHSLETPPHLGSRNGIRSGPVLIVWQCLLD